LPLSRNVVALNFKLRHYQCLARVALMFYICSLPPSQPIVDLNGGVSVAGIAAREGLTATTESAGKWRRNDL
jgi:hypothetical protein